MHEYDLFVPLRYNDGSPVDPAKLARLRQRLVDQFGGLTDLHQSHEGYWKIGGVTFRDEIVIYREKPALTTADLPHLTSLGREAADYAQKEQSPPHARFDVAWKPVK